MSVYHYICICWYIVVCDRCMHRHRVGRFKKRSLQLSKNVPVIHGRHMLICLQVVIFFSHNCERAQPRSWKPATRQEKQSFGSLSCADYTWSPAGVCRFGKQWPHLCRVWWICLLGFVSFHIFLHCVKQLWRPPAPFSEQLKPTCATML